MEPVTSFESSRYFSQPEFARWCASMHDDLNRYELLNGRIVMNPPSGWPQGEVSALVASVLASHVRPRKLGRVFGADQGFELPSGDTVSPDVSFVSTERWDGSAPHEPGRFLQVVPNLVVEILSPATASRDRGEKKLVYELNGVEEYWLVDATAQTVTQLVREGQRFGAPRTFEVDELIESSAVPGLKVSVEALVR